MADPFNIDLFLPRVGEVFQVEAEGSVPLPMVLTELAALPTRGDSRYPTQPFSLVFHAAAGSRIEQQIYRMEAEGLEPFDCLLVPIGPDENGVRVEAIFT
jgi:hypothetical protein